MNRPFARIQSISIACFFTVALLSTGSAFSQDSIQLREGTLDLVTVGIQSTGKTESQSFHQFNEPVAYRGAYFLVLQFDGVLSSEDRRKLELDGVKLEQFIAKNAYVARVLRTCRS